MKKILYLTLLDLNIINGGTLATLAYYRALCYLYPEKVDIATIEEAKYGEFSNIIGVPKRKWWDYIINFSIHRGKTFLSKFIKEHHNEYSSIIISNSRYGGDLIDLMHKYKLKVVVIHHNYEVEYTMQNKSIYTLKGHFSYLVSMIERKAYKNADINCFLTRDDMELLKQHYGESKGENFVIGTFELGNKSFSPSESTDLNQIIFTGAMCDYQTYHSIEIFEKRYLKILHDNYPNLKLNLAGRNPHKSIWDMKEKYPTIINVIPNPKNMNEVINKCSIFLCPTCLGGGLKLRIMDGLKKGLPILTHKVSARGYDVFFDKPYFQIYDDEVSFKKGLDYIVEYIRTQPNHRNIIIKDYTQYFSFENGVKRLKNSLKHLNIS